MDIARVVGATEKKDGYCTGNGYMVTWASGHLVSLALPDTYGYTKAVAEDLPMIPDPFRLVSRQIRTDRGMVTDIAASRQLKVIDEVFSKCDDIIVATDAGREGKLIFRWIYAYLGYTKPFQRLWISSLTDEAIRKGMANLKDGNDYDSLYAAADSRAKADWLVGMNASRALAIASGSANNSIGRVQTPTLAMICARFKENRNFISTPYWQLHITLKQGEAHRQFIHPKEFRDKKAAEAAYRKISSESVAAVTKAERKRAFQQPPLLYDLTALQKDCNIHYDLPVDKTLAITQSLYEKKLVSYPRTGSRYIPQDVMAHIPVLLEKITAMPEFREYRRSLDLSALNTRSVDAAKVTEHHALIITGIVPEGLSEAESMVYTLIAGRMLEAFSPPCEKELLLMECVCGGLDFHSRSTVIANPGWRAVFSRKEDREKDEPERDEGTASFTEGEEIPVMGHGLSQKKTLPKPLYTEATLLTAMENCGKEITNGQAREAVKDTGIGTPATRAAILEKLVATGFVERKKSKKTVNLIPTHAGISLITVLPEQLQSPLMTAEWEHRLKEIERGEETPETFMQGIRDMVCELVKTYKTVLGADVLFPSGRTVVGKCPRCGSDVTESKKGYFCERNDCHFGLWRDNRFLVAKKINLTKKMAEALLKDGKTYASGIFSEKTGKTYDAYIVLEDDGTKTAYRLEFERGKANGKQYS